MANSPRMGGGGKETETVRAAAREGGVARDESKSLLPEIVSLYIADVTFTVSSVNDTYFIKLKKVNGWMDVTLYDL
ncbi:hypothetical protein NDU88_004865 [Pleurodeles waltl]|uniref:Uncharacterized protein n=1 Tax=Pleurodeles waltl TaxID=8319 RepID=A0AAV7MUM9_PLEWA|nr:hypothetical protein NDU88_004865 [Pleurodeles waltl]